MTHDELKERYLNQIGTMALGAVLTEQPHWAHSDLADLYLPVRDAHPVFYGAYDWHSAVHGHWTLARLAQISGGDPDAVHLLRGSLTRPGILREVATMASGVLDRFEIPYGMAWVLRLEQTLLDGALPVLGEAGEALRPLADHARRRLSTWFHGLTVPDESGLHRNAAFSLTLIRESDNPLWPEAEDSILRWWGEPRPRNLSDEPARSDFISPTLEIADVVTAILDPAEREPWVRALLPSPEAQLDDFWPAVCPDPTDGLTGHLVGLNLARARALQVVGDRIPEGPLRTAFSAAAARHLAVGLEALDLTHFAVTHWIATFALRALDT